jgi:hypothetical protein
VQITALDLHHIFDTRDLAPSSTIGHLHLLHEAVQMLEGFQWVAVSESRRQPRHHIPRPEVKVARFWVCHSCESVFAKKTTADSDGESDADTEPCLSRYSEDAPPLSFAGGADPGRAFLPKRVAVRTSWRGAPKQCRLAAASPLETALLSRVRLHIAAVTVSSGNGGTSGGGYEVMRKHTVYFPQALMNEDTTATLQPLHDAEDAADALDVAVRGVRVVLVGPKGEWGHLEQRALAVTDFTLRPEVIFTNMQIHALVQRAGANATPSDLQRAHLDDADLGTLQSILTPEKLAALLREQTTRREANAADEALAEKQAADVAGVRVSDTEPGELVELDDTAACADLDGGPAAVFAAISDSLLSGPTRRQIRRGLEPWDDYQSQAETLYEAYRPLFLLGRGLVVGKCLSPREIRRLMLFYDCRFAASSPLCFSLADTTSRHNVNKCVSLRAKASPHAFAALKGLVSDDRFLEQLKEACQDPRGAVATRVLGRLLPFVKVSAAAVPFSDEKRAGFQGIMLAFQRYLGAGNMFVTWAPDDVHDPNALRDSFPYRGIGEFPHLHVDEYSPEGAAATTEVLEAFQRGESIRGRDFDFRAQQQRASKNPVAVTEHFHRRTLLAWEHLLGVDVERKKTCPFAALPKGALGRLAAMLYVTECNGRGSLHIHALTYGSILPEFVARVVHDAELRRAIATALDTQVTAQLHTDVHLARAVQKVLHVPTGYDASFRPFQVRSCEDRPDTPIDRERIRFCGHVAAMQRNIHRHGSSCTKPKRGREGCRFCAPWAHGFDRTRCLSLKPLSKEGDAVNEFYFERDVRWCRSCVNEPGVLTESELLAGPGDESRSAAGAAGRDGASVDSAVPPWYSDEWQHSVKERVLERGLLYNPVPITPLRGRLELVAAKLHNPQQAERIVRALRRPDDRCLVLEVARPCVEAPTKFEELKPLVDSLKTVLDRPSLQKVKEKLDALEQPEYEEVRAQIITEASGCVNGVVTSFCELISAALGCNTAIYTLGAGANAKAAGCYLSKYASKRQHERKQTTLVIAYEAAKHLRANPSSASDSGTDVRSAKHLSQRILNAGTEITATEAASINLHTGHVHRCAEVHSAVPTYIDAWGIYKRSCEAAGRRAPPPGRRRRAVPAANDAPDLRENFGIDTGETIPVETEYVRVYSVNGEIVTATQGQHYAYRSVELAHLNALEFFMLYDVQRSKARSSAARGGRGANQTYEFLAEHPLFQSYVIVRRSKMYLPLLAGSAAPRSPRKGSTGAAAHIAWGRWAGFYASLFIPWGCVGPASRGAARHHAPRLRVTDLCEWWQYMEIHSVVAWAHHLLRQPGPGATRRSAVQRRALDRLPGLAAVGGRVGRPTGAAWVDDYLAPFASAGGKHGLGQRFTIASYRLATLENMSGAFAAAGTDAPGIMHRGQSRDLWSRVGRPGPSGGGLAWDIDEVTDRLREDQATRTMLETLRSGRDYFAALRRAGEVAVLEERLRSKVSSNAAPAVSGASCPAWQGVSAPRGFSAEACELAATALEAPFVAAGASGVQMYTRATSTENPFAAEGATGTSDGTVLHECQRAVGRHFVACLEGLPSAVTNGLLCMGPAGTGKSKLVHALVRQVQRQGLGRLVVTGFTGVSCAPFLSPTILTLFNISAMHLKDTTPTAPELQAVKARFKKVAGFDPSALAGLVIDEISFMQPEVLGRVSRILQGIHDCDKPMGGVVYMLAGHLFQLPPVKAPGTWFLDLLRTVLRDRGDDVGATRAREQTRNFVEGLRVLRACVRFDLTYNFRAAGDPGFATALATLCDVDRQPSLKPVLDNIKLYDAAEQEYRFGPFVVLSNAERHCINRLKMIEYAKLHRVPIIRWRRPIKGLEIGSELYEHEPALWGYFVEGAPVQIVVNVNSSRGVANGSPALMHSLRFASAPRRRVQQALRQSGSYTGPIFVDVECSQIVDIVMRMSGADWHGNPLPSTGNVLPGLSHPVTGETLSGLAVIRPSNKEITRKKLTFGSLWAAQNGFRSATPVASSYELAFAVTDYKLQGMTLQRLVIVAGKPIPPLRHSRSSAYVQLSRVQRSHQNRLLLLDAEGRPLLEGVPQREELVVFERAYGVDGMFSSARALAAYDRVQSGDAVAADDPPAPSTGARPRKRVRRQLNFG